MRRRCVIAGSKPHPLCPVIPSVARSRPLGRGDAQRLGVAGRGTPGSEHAGLNQSMLCATPMVVGVHLSRNNQLGRVAATLVVDFRHSAGQLLGSVRLAA
jgi:hypothetical protein